MPDGTTGRHERADTEDLPPRRDRATEVADRSADGSRGLTFQKVFVMGGSLPESHTQHRSNWIGVLQEALQRGLHPKGKVKLVSIEESDPDRRGKVTTTATYEVAVEPASTDTDAPATATPSSARPNSS